MNSPNQSCECERPWKCEHAPASSSEPWEEEFHRRFYAEVGGQTLWASNDKEVSPQLKSFIKETLATSQRELIADSVKEMEAMEVDLLDEGTTPERMWEAKGFNAGISAAVRALLEKHKTL